MSDVPGIHEALAQAAGRIGALPKTEQNKEQHFAFRSIDAILAHAKPVFSELGISVTPRILEKDYEQVQSSRGTRGWRCTLTVEYTFTLGADGSSISTSMVGEAVDYGDKSSTKAAQMAFKYALTQVLSIGSTDADPDGETPEAVVPQTAEPELTPDEIEKKLQNRLKAKAYDLADGDKDLAQEFFDKYAPENWTLENVDISEKAMETGVA